MTYDHALDHQEVITAGGIMDFFIGILLIIFVAPMVGIIGRWIENAGREGLGKALSVGGYLLVLAIAGWLIIRSF
ncbi:hypothetical protein ABZ890_29265 [Streptomyces sp. NPDC046984]|uniref:hypothetical protein n=1 Tax=Streptomyces sp. NPDC046984 TaxID=3155138 RepID=UPI0033E5C929